MARIARCVLVMASLLVLVVNTGAQVKPTATPMQPRIGVMTFHGMAGIVTSVSSSEMQLRVPEHVTLTVYLGPSARVTEDGQPASVSSIHPGSGVIVRGEFDIQARKVDAATVALMPPTGLRLLQVRTANFGKTWTAGMVTGVQPSSMALQRMDGTKQTIQLDTDTAYDFQNRSVPRAWLREGERVDVEFPPGQPSVASRVLIQGKVRN